MSELSVRPIPPGQLQRLSPATENTETEQTRPGRSGEAVGQQARAAVSAAQEAGTPLPSNAQGLAASQIARTGTVDLTALLQIQSEAQPSDDVPSGASEEPTAVEEGETVGETEETGTTEPTETTEVSTGSGDEGRIIVTDDDPSGLIEPTPLPPETEVPSNDDDGSGSTEQPVTEIFESDDPLINVIEEPITTILSEAGTQPQEAETILDILNNEEETT